MKLFYRRIIYIIFILIFFITAPLVIMYTQGYKFNFKRVKFQKTGILSVSSIPKKADIYLNGQIVEGKNTPNLVDNLLPGDYEIKLHKEGYHDWQKKLWINENTTTFAEKIYLWPISTPESLGLTVKDWRLISDQNKIALVDNQQNILIYNLNNKELTTIKKNWPTADINIIEENDKNILLKLTREDKIIGYVILNINDAKAKYVSAGNQAEKISLHNNENKVYLINQIGLSEINLNNNQTTLINKSSGITDSLTNTQGTFFLTTSSLYFFKNQKSVEKISNLNCDSCQFYKQNRNNEKLLLNDSVKQQLVVINLANGIIQRFSAKNIDRLNNNSILFYNDWEIWIYHLDQKEPELITRIGQPIQYAMWHPFAKHIIFGTSNEIKIIELDNRENRNIISLAASNKLKTMSLGKKANDLYYSDDNGLFRIILNKD